MQQIKGRSLVFHLSDIVRYSIKALVKYTCIGNSCLVDKSWQMSCLLILCMDANVSSSHQKYIKLFAKPSIKCLSSASRRQEISGRDNSNILYLSIKHFDGDIKTFPRKRKPLLQK